MSDLKFALRQLLKNSGFSAVAMLTLALGIDANTTIFNVLNSTLGICDLKNRSVMSLLHSRFDYLHRKSGPANIAFLLSACIGSILAAWRAGM
jgi:hypothetical protein